MSLAVDLARIGSGIRIHGSRIAAYLDPLAGNGGRFTVEVEETCDPSASLSELDLKDLSKPVRTNVNIVGFNRAYSLPDMDLTALRTRLTPIDKARIYELQYDVTVIDSPTFPQISLENFSAVTLAASNQGISANYALQTSGGQALHGETCSERLLYFQANVLLGGGAVARFVSRRNKFNSWMVTLVAQLNAMATSQQNQFEGFKIDFTPQEVIVDSNTLSLMVVEEVQGHYLEKELESLHALGARVGQPLEAAPTETYSVASLLAASRSEDRRKINHGETYEIATLFFQPGHYRELALIR